MRPLSEALAEPRWPPPGREVEEYEVRGLTIQSDLPICVAADRVFPLFEDESVYLADTIEIQRGWRVLDVGTGSGLLALVSAACGAEVIGTDVNPLALSCAAFNAKENGLSERVTWKLCNHFDGLPSEHFDLVLANPPFLPVPAGLSLFVSSDAGEDGLRVVGPLLSGVRSVLRPGGRIALLALSFEGASGLLLEDLAARAFSDPADSIRLLDSYGDALPIEDLCALFDPSARTSDWLAKLQRQGFEGLRYILLEARREGDLPAPRPRPVFRDTQFSGSWRARLSRYEMWLRTLRSGQGLREGA